jgi:hypothetical protein
VEGDDVHDELVRTQMLIGTSLFSDAPGSPVHRLVVDQAYVPWVTSMATLPEGFRRSGRVIADRLIENDSEFDYLFLPMMYMYRHSLELHLKQARRAAATYLRESRPQESLRQRGPGHKLVKTWELLRDDLERCGYFPTWAHLSEIEKRIVEFESLDPSGQALRYPGMLRDLKDETISVTTIADVIDEVLAALDGIVTGLHELARIPPASLES